MMKRFAIWVFIAVVLAGCSVQAQNNVGRITGTVTDPLGGLIPNAKVTLVNAATGATVDSVTDNAGFYVFASIPAGTYSISASSPGFSTRKQDGIVLDAASVRTADFLMAAGATTDQVTVEANVQQVDTTTAQVSTTIDGRQLENIALNGRNPIQMLRLLPGTVATTIDPFTVNVSATAQQVNGVRGASMMMMIDGIANLDNGGNTSVRAITNPDSISEMRVLTSSFSAEYYGRAAALMNVITKSGTHDFHGSAFEFVRNQIFDADTYFFVPQPGTPKTPLHFNDYGYTLGGPIFIPGHFNASRKRMFFFIDQEWRSSHVGATNVDTVPTAAEKGGDFTALSTVIIDPLTNKQISCNNVLNVICPSRFSVNGPKLLSAIPNPQTAALANNYVVTRNNNFDSREDRVNFDFIQSDRTAYGARWTEATNYQYQGFFEGNLGIGAGAFPRPMYMYSGFITHSFSPTLVNSLNLGASHNVLIGTPYNTAVLRSTLGLTYPEIYPGQAYPVPAAPSLNITGYTGYTAGSLAQKSLRDLQINDDLTKVLGNHVLKAGVLVMQSTDTEPKLSQGSSNGVATFSTGGSGNAIANALLGNFSQYTEDQTGGFFASHYFQYEFYVQDSWRFNRRLTFNYGMRYLLNPAPTNPYNDTTLFNPALYVPSHAPQVTTSGVLVPNTGNIYNGLELLGSSFSSQAKSRFPSQTSNAAVLGLFGGLPQGGALSPKKNFAPRLGIAFDPKGNGATAIRIGFGFFYDHLTHAQLSQGALQLPFDQFANVFSGNIDNPGGANTNSFPPFIYSLPLKYKQPVVYDANMDVQQQLPFGIIADIGYVGTFGHHLYRITNINQPLPGSVQTGVNKQNVRPYPGYDDIAQVGYADNSNYNSLQTTISKRARNGLSFSGSFTWSKTLDDTSQNPLYGQFPENSYNIKQDYGISDIHRSKVVTMNAVYNLPFFKKGNRVETLALGGWTLSTVFLAQSGPPNNIIVTSDYAQIGTVYPGAGAGANSPGVAYERAQQIGNPNLPKSSRSARGVWFNAAAFTTPGLYSATGTYGNVARNSLIGPGFNSLDLSGYKHFKLGDKADFEFRAESFNTINHPSLSGLGNVVGTGTFGKVTGAGPGRVLQFGAKMVF